jgi:uncharacterized protein YfaT (DUF1175 family)
MNLRRMMLALSLAGVVVCAAVSGAKLRARHRHLAPVRIAIQPSSLLADGYDTAVLSLETSATGTPRIWISDTSSGARIEQVSGTSGRWSGRIRAGILPGRVTVRAQFPGSVKAAAELNLLLDSDDRSEDGMPDFMRLDDEHDQQAFRRWFTYIAEAQYFQTQTSRPAEINDCAALIRYAYRAALSIHDGAWADSASLPIVPAMDSVAKYQYPRTPLSASLFRVRAGPFRPTDLENGAFLQFADASTLWRFNTHFVSRDLSRARRGDLLFYRQRTDHETFHSMIFVGESQFEKDGRHYVLYHTGPDGKDPGEIKRLSIDELLSFPQPEWRPLAGNPSFLGVARWNILRRNDLDAKND